MIGVKNLEGMLGTDIFWSDGFVIAAAARLGAIVVKTVIGLIMEPLTLCFESWVLVKLPLFGEYEPGPGNSSFGLLACNVVTFLLMLA